MKVLVVFESMFGNTAAIAAAVARGLSETADVELREIATAPLVEGFDLVVAGAPTHAFSLSRPASREDAIKHGGEYGAVTLGLREWLGRLSRTRRPVNFAAFDTRIGKARHLPGSAAAKATRIARRLGYRVLDRQSFLVHGTSGPLLNGELARAEDWGRSLVGAEANAQSTARD